MTEASKLMTVDPSSSTMDAMSLMIKFNFRHVPVVGPPLAISDYCYPTMTPKPILHKSQQSAVLNPSWLLSCRLTMAPTWVWFPCVTW